MSIFLELAVRARKDARIWRRMAGAYPSYPDWEAQCKREACQRYLHALDYLKAERKLRKAVQ